MPAIRSAPAPSIRYDVVTIAAIVSFTIVFANTALNLSVLPFEDAAILMRYSLHVAQGNGIVWNIGEQPIDGGTDFLAMILTAVFNSAGLSIESSVRLLSGLSHLLTVVIIFRTLRVRQGSGLFPASITALFFGIGPGLYFFASYFTTPFFGLCAALHWLTAAPLLDTDVPTRRQAVLFAVSGLMLGLARPEGAILSVLVFAGIILTKGWKSTGLIRTTYLAIFAGAGLLYFLWRWNYFGYPLPNPFYKKGGGTLYWESLAASLVNGFRLTFPFLIPVVTLAILWCWDRIQSRTENVSDLPFGREGYAVILPLAGFSCVWILLSNEMNYFMRFQYPLLVLVLLTWYPIAERKLPASGIFYSATMRNALWLTVLLSIVSYQILSNGRSGLHRKDGRYAVAKILSDYKHEGYTLATTEAGLLPLYSEWRSVDTWGLNDPWITHHGGITGEYLDRYKPEVIMVLAYYTPIAEQYEPIPFVENVRIIREYAEKNHYTLAAAFGVTPFSSHAYYVKRGFPRHDDIVKRIAQTEYHWFANGERCVNFAALPASR